MVEQVHAHDWNHWVGTHKAEVIDVRDAFEWNQGVLPGSQLISLNELPTSLDDLDKSKPVLMVCRSGARSDHAASFLLRAGFSKVANLNGGLAALGLA